MAYGWGWRKYVPVAKRRAQAILKMEKLRKKGVTIQPVSIEGRQIARTFWGRAWCEHLEKFSDFANRLPRGRTYVRNGSVCHLDIQRGVIAAKVSGSELYEIEIKIGGLSKNRWGRVKSFCAGQVGSLLELLQGMLSDSVMGVVTDKDQGIFPRPGEMSLDCSCPDWANMCKHVAAVLYGVGARLDEKPELLFLLRGVDHTELVSEDVARAIVRKPKKMDRKTLDEEKLSDVFGIDLAPRPSPKAPRTRKSVTLSKTAISPKARAIAKKERAPQRRSTIASRAKRMPKPLAIRSGHRPTLTVTTGAVAPAEVGD